MTADELTAETVENVPSVAERKGMRGHDDSGSVRPADGRWKLHEPDDESEVCGPANAVSSDDVSSKRTRKRAPR